MQRTILQYKVYKGQIFLIKRPYIQEFTNISRQIHYENIYVLLNKAVYQMFHYNMESFKKIALSSLENYIFYQQSSEPLEFRGE
uniref:HTH LytTR-type domain-containing protein n=1 Tax=Strongyloides papillosus TaxID=174720 RepID=A0A0N5BYF6_STREA